MSAPTRFEMTEDVRNNIVRDDSVFLVAFDSIDYGLFLLLSFRATLNQDA